MSSDILSWGPHHWFQALLLSIEIRKYFWNIYRLRFEADKGCSTSGFQSRIPDNFAWCSSFHSSLLIISSTLLVLRSPANHSHHDFISVYIIFIIYKKAVIWISAFENTWQQFIICCKFFWHVKACHLWSSHLTSMSHPQQHK